MKYGLVTFRETENIGDDIQSYSAIRFLPKIDYYIEREKLDLFLPKEKKQIITIMNGWYLHSKINFPISPYILPLFISTHFSSYNSEGIRTEYLNEYSSNYLNKYGPIGCRDYGTMRLLDNCNVENYFSGCLTLTIQRDKKIKKQNYICIVDIEKQAEDYLVNKIGNEIEIIKRTHILNKEENSKLNWNERFNNVKNLLNTYQSAKLVITSRLHCALPCLALGTPVLLLYDEEKEYTKDRLGDYAAILNHMTTKDFIKNGVKTIKSGINNPKKYLKIRNSIEKNLKDSLKNIEDKKDNNLPKLSDYQRLYIEPKKNIDYIHKVAIGDNCIKKRDYINLNYECDYWKKEYKYLNKKLETLIKELEKKDLELEKKDLELEKIQKELNLIKNSKSWKILRKLVSTLK